MPKPSYEWDESDLENLIKDQVREAIDLEYKGCDSLQKNDSRKKNEVSKDVAAFANSAGGTIVYGILDDKNIPIGIDRGYDPLDISKEWLEQIINSRIQRKIDGIRINAIDLHKTSPGRVAYAVYIPQSLRAPHQSYDKKFYKRYNFESVPMEEYEIRDVMRRSETPDVRMSLALVGSESPGSFLLGISVDNHSSAPAPYFVAILNLPWALVLKGGQNRFSPLRRLATLQRAGREFPAAAYEMAWAPPSNVPVFEGTTFSLADMSISLPVQTGEYPIWGDIRGPGFRCQTSCVLSYDGVQMQMIEHQHRTGLIP